jgi:translation initiation factor 1
MAKKNISNSGIVFSTDPNFKPEFENESEETILPQAQLLKIKLQTKHRAGKVVTLVQNYIGPDEEKESLCKKLKAFCGTGGSYKDGEIIIQGDQRDKVLQWLLKHGFIKSK